MPFAPELFSAPVVARIEERRNARVKAVPFFDGLSPDGSATNGLAGFAPDARFVKAFNTTFAGPLTQGEVAGTEHARNRLRERPEDHRMTQRRSP